MERTDFSGEMGFQAIKRGNGNCNCLRQPMEKRMDGRMDGWIDLGGVEVWREQGRPADGDNVPSVY